MSFFRSRLPSKLQSFKTAIFLTTTCFITADENNALDTVAESNEKVTTNALKQLELAPVTRLACGSCYKPTSKNAAVWETITKTKPQLFLFMGDNVYADTEDMDKMKASYAKLLNNTSYQEFTKVHKILPTWDDHDYGKNDAGVEYPMKKESQQIFLDTFGFKTDHPARKQAGIYHSYFQGPEGQRLQVINLDTRYHRSALERKKIGKRKSYVPSTNPDATMLGSKQWKWLETELNKQADLRIIVSSIQVITEDHRFEKWANIPTERKKFFALLKSTNAKNVVLLSGDRHLAELAVIKPEESGLDHDLVEMTSSGMTHAGAWSDKNRHRVEGSYFKGKNFGTIDIDWKHLGKPKVTLSIQILGEPEPKVFKSKVIQF